MKHKKLLSWLALLFWMALIFALSSQSAEPSDKLSKSIAENVMVIAEKAVPTWNISIKKLNYIVRKNAHFFSYFILGVLMINALRASSVYARKDIFLSVLMCILYAISDEIHQLFVLGRSGQVKDVIIDGAGAVVGIIGYVIFSKVLKSKKLQHIND